ncbi:MULTISPECIES: hypothetical protein [Bradyrhizobium]|uniref:Bacteriocin n=1 Tax=Bradyrhizobium septentrionale TaxID=1404411 RepID=A0ABZ2PDS8_9BRAD|nr:hypothetical protein [Bradyrhizobium barranii]UPU01474.1 hypothetical protein J4G48_0048300 [Bradyrhizobium barranii subsp. apii]
MKSDMSDYDVTELTLEEACSTSGGDKCIIFEPPPGGGTIDANPLPPAGDRGLM